jgi:hypothetical protein
MACEDCEDASFTHFYAWCFREKKPKKPWPGPTTGIFRGTWDFRAWWMPIASPSVANPRWPVCRRDCFFSRGKPGYFTMRTFVVGFIYKNEIVSGIYRIFDVYPLVM